MLPDSIATGQNVWRAALRSDNAYQSWKAFSTSPAVADTDSMRTIANIGVNESSNYYFSVFEGVNTKCQYGVIFQRQSIAECPARGKIGKQAHQAADLKQETRHVTNVQHGCTGIAFQAHFVMPGFRSPN
jgi:hypothetical protein